MKVSFSGQILKLGTGKNRETGKEYMYADIYDGDALVRVYNFPDGYTVGQYVDDIPVNLRSDSRIFASVSTRQ